MFCLYVIHKLFTKFGSLNKNKIKKSNIDISRIIRKSIEILTKKKKIQHKLMNRYSHVAILKHLMQKCILYAERCKSVAATLRCVEHDCLYVNETEIHTF